MNTKDNGTLATNLDHVNILVKDIQKTASVISETLGIGPWLNWDYTAQKGETSSGEPFKINGAWARLGPIILELIAPVSGNSVWSQALDDRGEALHHLCFMVPNWEETVAELQAKGCKLLDSGGFLGKHWAYLEINPGGLVIEVGQKGMHDEEYQKLG